MQSHFPSGPARCEPSDGSKLSMDKSSGDSTEVCSRLRPFEVQGIKVPMPLQSGWAQHNEWVRVLRQVRAEHGNGRRKPKRVYTEMQSRNVLTIGYRAAMEKVHRVDDALVLNPHRSAHESIDTRIHDRLTRDETSKGYVGTSWPRTSSRMRCVSVPAWLGKDDDESHGMKWPFYFLISKQAKNICARPPVRYFSYIGGPVTDRARIHARCLCRSVACRSLAPSRRRARAHQFPAFQAANTLASSTEIRKIERPGTCHRAVHLTRVGS